MTKDGIASRNLFLNRQNTFARINCKWILGMKILGIYDRTVTVAENSLFLTFETATTGRVLAISSQIIRFSADTYILPVLFFCILLYTYKRICQTLKIRYLETFVVKLPLNRLKRT